MNTFKVYPIGVDNQYSNWWLEYEGELTFLGKKDRNHEEMVSWKQAVEKAKYFIRNGTLPLEMCICCGHHTYQPKESLGDKSQARAKRKQLRERRNK